MPRDQDEECLFRVEARQPIQGTRCLEPVIQIDYAGLLTFAGDGPGHDRSVSKVGFAAAIPSSSSEAMRCKQRAAPMIAA